MESVRLEAPSVQIIASEGGAPIEARTQLVDPEAPRQHAVKRSGPRLFGAKSLLGIGLALMMGFGVAAKANAQTIDPADQCRRDTAWAASIGAELGRQIDPQHGGPIGGALAALLQKAVGCNSTAEVATTPQIKQLNQEIDEALALDGARFTTDATLPDEMKRILDYVAGELANKYPTVKLLVVSHANTESVSLLNRGLSRERADAVLAYLKDAGVKQTIEITAAGDTEGKNRLELVIAEPQQPGQNLFGIPGLTIQFGNGHHRGPVVRPGQVPNGTVQPNPNRGQPNLNFPGGANQNGVGNQGGNQQRSTPGPGTSGWNGH